MVEEKEKEREKVVEEKEREREKVAEDKEKEREATDATDKAHDAGSTDQAHDAGSTDQAQDAGSTDAADQGPDATDKAEGDTPPLRTPPKIQGESGSPAPPRSSEAERAAATFSPLRSAGTKACSV